MHWTLTITPPPLRNTVIVTCRTRTSGIPESTLIPGVLWCWCYWSLLWCFMMLVLLIFTLVFYDVGVTDLYPGVLWCWCYWSLLWCFMMLVTDLQFFVFIHDDRCLFFYIDVRFTSLLRIHYISYWQQASPKMSSLSHMYTFIFVDN